MATGKVQSIKWRLSGGGNILPNPLKDPEVQRDKLANRGAFIRETKTGEPFLEVAIEDRSVVKSKGTPKVAEHTKRSETARKLFTYKGAKENWLKRSAKVLLLQGGAHKVASEAQADIKIAQRVSLLAREASMSPDVNVSVNANEGQAMQVASASVGGAITLLGLATEVYELGKGIRAYRKGTQKVNAAAYAQETYDLARKNLDATVATQKEIIEVARQELNHAQAGRVLGEGMRSNAKKAITQSGILAATEVAELTATGLELATAISPAMEGASIVSSFATGIGIANTLVCLPLQGYSLYTNLISTEEHLATKKAAENLCKEYGIAEKKDPELELIGNMVKERQAYKGKGFTAGMTALKIFGSVIGLVAAAGGLVAATGTVAATAFAVMTPIGWAISAGATLGLIGYGLYKMGKYIQRRMKIRELNKFAAHTSPLADKEKLPKLSEKQQVRLEAFRYKALQELSVELERMPTTEEIESKVHVEMIERLLKVDAEFAAQVLFARFHESINEYSKSEGIAIDDLTHEDFIKAGGGAAFLEKMHCFDLEMLKAIAHSDMDNSRDAITLIKKRLHI